jgi:hypothetical protein
VAADFLRSIASRRTAAPEAPARALDALVADLGERHDLPPSEQAMVTAYGRACLERLAADCAALDPGVPIGRKAVGCLLVDDGDDAAERGSVTGSGSNPG